jgi:hypothetical protein
MSVTPEEDRVFKDCIHENAVVFISVYIDNTAVCNNCETLVKRFHVEVRNDRSIDLIFYWQSYLVFWVSDIRMMNWQVLFLLSDAITKQGNKRQVNPTKIPIICNADLGVIPITERQIMLVYFFKFQMLIGELMFSLVLTQVQRYLMHSVFYRVIWLRLHRSMAFTPVIYCVMCGAEGMPNKLGALVKSILHSNQDNFTPWLLCCWSSLSSKVGSRTWFCASVSNIYFQK